MKVTIMSVIFYFSGTGNCLDVAKQAAAVLKDCRLEPISRYIAKPYRVEDEIMGIVSPVFSASLPPYVQEFLAKLEAAPQYTFSIVTMGGMQGRALKCMQKLLLKRDITLNYSATVLMPDNIFNTPELKASQMLTAADQALAKIVSDIHAGKQDVSQCQESYLWKYGGISLCWWYLRTFLKIGQFKVDCDACVSCGQCAKICPVGNIKMVNGRPAFGDNCTTCLACVHWCPKHAIQMGSVNKMGSKRYVNPNIKIQEMFNQEGK